MESRKALAKAGQTQKLNRRQLPLEQRFLSHFSSAKSSVLGLL
jgi:hypothetical protein